MKESIAHHLLTFHLSYALNQFAVEVRVLRLASVVNDAIATRKLPPSPAVDVQLPPKVFSFIKRTQNTSRSNLTLMCQVVVKMDIEGSELEVMPDLLLSGAMKHIDLMFVESKTFTPLTMSPSLALILNPQSAKS